MRKSELLAQIAEKDAIINKYEHLFEKYDEYNSICEAISKRRNKLDNIEADIATAKHELYHLNDEKIKQIYNPEAIYNICVPSNADGYYDQKIDNIKHELECVNQDIMGRLPKNKSEKWFCSSNYMKMDMYRDYQPHEVIELCQIITWLVEFCIILKCDCLAKEINLNNLDKIYNKAFKFRDCLEGMLKFTHLKISDDVFEYPFKKFRCLHQMMVLREEKREERRRQAEIVREQEALEKELENKEKELKKTEDSYTREVIKEEINIIENNLKNKRAGWLYVISNKDMKDGSYKLGITRRTDAMVRIKELSDASHSFMFDVHGFIWSEDVFKLEADIHRYFADRRINNVNWHKEHFICTLDEVEEALKYLGYETKLNRDVYNYDYEESKRVFAEKNIKFID
ncbi:MAG: GIY-YIG nuclease family protein [Prevotellaceae bacterium]|nr:GIY-YIG nuclease family protein [Candidatus Faecinaster equi]